MFSWIIYSIKLSKTIKYLKNTFDKFNIKWYNKEEVKTANKNILINLFLSKQVLTSFLKIDLLIRIVVLGYLTDSLISKITIIPKKYKSLQKRSLSNSTILIKGSIQIDSKLYGGNIDESV